VSRRQNPLRYEVNSGQRCAARSHLRGLERTGPLPAAALLILKQVTALSAVFVRSITTGTMRVLLWPAFPLRALHRERPVRWPIGGAPGKVNLYVGKTPVKFNIPEAEAVDRLKDLIREHGKWVEPASQTTAVEVLS
jgi:hypothetical protein